jgi:DNA-binding response OmpR family regulator
MRLSIPLRPRHTEPIGGGRVSARILVVEAGASAYLPKPFIYGELLACVRRLTATDQASGSSRGAPSGG